MPRFKKINWTNQDKVTIRPPHRRDFPLAAEFKAALVGKLVPGQLFRVVLDLHRIVYDAKVTPHIFPVLESSYWNMTNYECAIKVGAIAMYSSLIRVEEQGNKGIISVPRHTFIINGGRFIINSLIDVYPLN